MISKTAMFLSAALLLGTLGAATAGSDKDEPSGGSDIGPMGQCFSPPDCGQRYRGDYSYASAPGHQVHHPRAWHRTR
jgi:hypothetical protein